MGQDIFYLSSLSVVLALLVEAVNMSIEHWWNDTEREQPKYWKRQLSQCYIFHRESHRG
jgi:hypothetical protein